MSAERKTAMKNDPRNCGLEEAAKRAMELIGAGNDTNPAEIKAANINEAWHVLDRALSLKSPPVQRVDGLGEALIERIRGINATISEVSQPESVGARLMLRSLERRRDEYLNDLAALNPPAPETMDGDLVEALKIALAEASVAPKGLRIGILSQGILAAISAYEARSVGGGELPWDDLKVCFGIHDPDPLWEAHGNETLGLPEGWEFNETDCSGARCVAIFRVEVLPTSADAKRVQAEIIRVGAAPPTKQDGVG